MIQMQTGNKKRQFQRFQRCYKNELFSDNKNPSHDANKICILESIKQRFLPISEMKMKVIFVLQTMSVMTGR